MSFIPRDWPLKVQKFVGIENLSKDCVHNILSDILGMERVYYSRNKESSLHATDKGTS